MFGKLLKFIFAVIIIIGLGELLIIGFNEILTIFKTTDSTLAAAIVTAAASIILGFAITIYSQERIKKRELEDAHREAKIELYNKFILFLVRLLSGSNELTTGDAPTEQEMIDFMVQFKRDLLLRASPKVIKAQLEYEIAAQNDNSSDTIAKYVDKLILEMRKDIGLSNNWLNNYETIQLFLKDKSEINQIT